jgi:hypothetical protein
MTVASERSDPYTSVFDAIRRRVEIAKTSLKGACRACPNCPELVSLEIDLEAIVRLADLAGTVSRDPVQSVGEPPQGNLVSIDDIARKYRVHRRTVAERWVHLPNFPKPRYAPTAQTRLWDAIDVERWAGRAPLRSK